MKKIFGVTLCAWIAVVAQGAMAQQEPVVSRPRSFLEVRVVRLIYRSAVPDELDWSLIAQAADPPSVETPDDESLHAEPALIRRVFSLRHPLEEQLEEREIHLRVSLFTDLLRKGLDLPLSHAPEGRRLEVLPEGDRVLLVDTEMNHARARIYHESLFPPPVAQPQPLQSLRPGVNIQLQQVRHRPPGEMADLFNRIAGRTRDSQLEEWDDDMPRLPIRVTPDDLSGYLIITTPRGESPDAYSHTPIAPRSPTRVSNASVRLEQPEEFDSLQLHRLGEVNYHALRQAVQPWGKLEIIKERKHILTHRRPLTLHTGYRMSAPEAFASHSGVSIHCIPFRQSPQLWNMAFIVEQVKWRDYPIIEKDFLDFATLLSPGDTIVCRGIYTLEPTDSSSGEPAELQKVERMIFIRLVVGSQTGL